MSDAHGESKTKTYLIIFGILFLLTALEVYIGKAGVGNPDPHVWLGLTTPRTLMLLLAVAKAGLVGAYFMHLKWETSWMKFIALTPAFLLFFAIWLMAEVIYRTPEAPDAAAINQASTPAHYADVVPMPEAGGHHGEDAEEASEEHH